MSIDISLIEKRWVDVELFDGQITGNLWNMAEEAGIAHHIWRPWTVGLSKAHHLINPLRDAIARIEADPARFDRFAAAEPYSKRANLLRFLKQYLRACMKHPEADIQVGR